MKTDRWYYEVFQSAPDLIRGLLPGGDARIAGLGVDPAEPGDRVYRFEALELKERSHRLDGVLWPRQSSSPEPKGSAEVPVVLLEVQMQADAGFQHRLSVQTHRLLQLHPQVEHLEVVVITPHHRLKLGPSQPPRLLQVFVDEVHWISLEALSQEPELDPLLTLLTLPVRPVSELGVTSQRILKSRPDLAPEILLMLVQRFPALSEEEIMVIAGIPREEIRHTRAVQQWLEEGRQEGEAAVTLRQLNRRCGPLSDATRARIQSLPLEQLVALLDALLDFEGLADLEAWLQRPA